MKKLLLSLLVMSALMLSVVPGVFAAGIGQGFGGAIGVEEFVPIVWQCGDRVLTDDYSQPWRITDCDSECHNRYSQQFGPSYDSHDACRIECDKLSERAGNYLFEGEKYQLDVVVFDKNKIEEVATDLILGSSDAQTVDEADFNINCVPVSEHSVDFENCNARIGEESIHNFDSATMQAYTCTITVLDSEHMNGFYWLTVLASDGTNSGVYDEKTPIFINPMIDLDVQGALDFSGVRPGTSSYSQITVENTAEGGVALDMFITGKNWPAADTNMGRCLDPLTGQLTNYLSLGAFSYYAENGAYSTRSDEEKDHGYGLVKRSVDDEGYVNIDYQMETGFTTEMFNDAEVIQAGGPVVGHVGYRANVLNPGNIMALTLRLNLPEPCYGQFESQTDGSIFLWAEAI